MKVSIRQFMGKQHSWCVVGQNFAKYLIDLGHEVHIFSTDGIKHFPEELKLNLIGYVEEDQPQKVYGRLPDKEYDCQISYTCMKNFPVYLGNGNKNRFGIWCYEWSGENILPTGFAKNYKSCDKILSPSNYAKQIYIDSKIPEDHIVVLSHGIDENQFRNAKKINLKTNKKFKIFSNIIQNHLRKNIPGLLDAYGKAFTNKDDVCLVLKANMNPVKMQFEISTQQCLNNFYKKYSNHGEVRIITEYVTNIADLYYSCDAIFTMSNAEGFYFPGLEGLAVGKHSIAPAFGGQLDFLNSENSLLIDGRVTRANPLSMYWESKNNAKWFEPSISDAVDKLKYSYNNFEILNNRINTENILEKYSWKTITKDMLYLCV